MDRLTGKELGEVSRAMWALHELEDRDQLGPAATPERAFNFLAGMMESGDGLVVYAQNALGFTGCVVLQFNALPEKDAILVGGLWVQPNAPKNTVLQLFDAVIFVAQERQKKSLWLLAAPGKNDGRKTYTRLGFTDTGLRDGASKLYTTTLPKAEAGMRQMLRHHLDLQGKYYGINR